MSDDNNDVSNARQTADNLRQSADNLRQSAANAAHDVANLGVEETLHSLLVDVRTQLGELRDETARLRKGFEKLASKYRRSLAERIVLWAVVVSIILIGVAYYRDVQNRRANNAKDARQVACTLANFAPPGKVPQLDYLRFKYHCGKYVPTPLLHPTATPTIPHTPTVHITPGAGSTTTVHASPSAAVTARAAGRTLTRTQTNNTVMTETVTRTRTVPEPGPTVTVTRTVAPPGSICLPVLCG